MEVQVKKGLETVTVELPDGATLKDIEGDGVVIFLNGEQADPDTELSEGDEVQQVPKSGKLGQEDQDQSDESDDLDETDDEDDDWGNEEDNNEDQE